MRRNICCLFAIVCLSAMISGCSSQEQLAAASAATTEITYTLETAEETTAVATVEESHMATANSSDPPESETETAIPTESETESTVPAETAPKKPRDPVLELPEVSGDPTDFFSDAAFLGDSISYSLFVYQNKTGELGSPKFLVRGKLGLQNTLQKVLKVYYQGVEMTPWEALAASGAKKVFIMLGTNDIGYYGIDETMDRWVLFVEKIRELSPDMEIYIQSLTPMWTESQQKLLNNEYIDLYNQRLEAFANDNDCHFVNIAPYFKDSTNGLAQKYSGDRYVHMCEEGVSAWVTVLKAYAAEQQKEIA